MRFDGRRAVGIRFSPSIRERELPRFDLSTTDMSGYPIKILN